MTRKALFPGTFDPFTKGHEATVQQMLPLFDEVIVAIAINPKKQTLFPLEQRLNWIASCFCNEPKVKVFAIDGLVAAYCQKHQIGHLVRGVRNTIDFSYEYELAQGNKAFFNIETIFLPANPELIAVSSSIVRELYNHGKDPSKYLPDSIKLF